MKKKEAKLFHHALPSFPNHSPNLKFQGKKWSLTITQLMSRIHFYDKRSYNETLCNIEKIYGSSPLA
jgi:hypothetical protein